MSKTASIFTIFLIISLSAGCSFKAVFEETEKKNKELKAKVDRLQIEVLEEKLAAAEANTLAAKAATAKEKAQAQIQAKTTEAQAAEARAKKAIAEARAATTKANNQATKEARAKKVAEDNAKKQLNETKESLIAQIKELRERSDKIRDQYEDTVQKIEYEKYEERIEYITKILDEQETDLKEISNSINTNIINQKREYVKNLDRRFTSILNDIEDQLEKALTEIDQHQNTIGQIINDNSSEDEYPKNIDDRLKRYQEEKWSGYQKTFWVAWPPRFKPFLLEIHSKILDLTASVNINSIP